MGMMLSRIALAVWVVIWAVFLVRPAFKKDIIRDYSSLLKLSAEGKRAYVTGPRLYEFIVVCNQVMPKPSSYEIVGLEKDSLEHRRVKYYLYPNLEKADPEFILAYGIKDYERAGYGIFKILDLDRYILRRAK